MILHVHHRPIATASVWHLHVWQRNWNGNASWDPPGTPGGLTVDFTFPDVPDPRSVAFKYFSTALAPDGAAATRWEPDDFVRRLSRIPAAAIWTFEQSGRVLYRDPTSAAAPLEPGETLTFTAITKTRFRGGRIYAWNPYDADRPEAYFAETARDDARGTSTFDVRLADWMRGGFHLKLVGRDGDGRDVWGARREQSGLDAVGRGSPVDEERAV